SNIKAASKEPNIQCVEVVISRNYLRDHTNNLLWTLSVYSLENQPVKKDHAIPNSEGFHFMVYDWTRTIKQLLEQNQIPYSVIGFFSLESIYPEAVSDSETSHSFLMA
ncbi:MAG TPA: hypothetical protein VFM90_02910, partial [Cyclobacteriaceae bacterium]|nr:hypothetical protein [Cyclobacteriaceae bacterium]